MAGLNRTRVYVGFDVQSPFGVEQVATGGVKSEIVDRGVRYIVHEFTAVGSVSFIPSGELQNVEYLVVGGGGGGGGSASVTAAGGGGGGGGVVTNLGSPITVSGSVSVVVGAGGLGGGSASATSGAASSFGSFTAAGGGRGGGEPSSGRTPATGAAGGGGYGSTVADTTNGATGNPGGNGGNGFGSATATLTAGGGGGGAGGSGTDAASSAGGNGGVGLPVAILGSSQVYGGGGGGAAAAADGSQGIGGSGGGGNASTGTGITAASGVANTGGGGGGAGRVGGSVTGGAGGSGVVIVRYRKFRPFSLTEIASANLTDVTQYVDSVSIRRGRSRELDTFPSGNAQVTFRNENRTFDPLFRDGPFFGKIKPLKRILVEFDDIPIFSGVIDDWNLDYNLNNLSIATANCVDGLASLSQTSIDSFTNSEQIPGDRIETILRRAEVNYPGVVSLDPGLNLLQGDTVQADANTLNYLQIVADTDVGRLFVDGAGVLRYRDRTAGIVQNPRIVLADNSEYIEQLSVLSNAVLWFDASSPQPVRVDADAQAQWILQDAVLWFDASDPDYLPPVLGFSGIEVDFGTEFLYNRISVTSVGQAKVTAIVQSSIDEFGVRTLSRDGYLFLGEAATDAFAEFLASLYSQPEVRISNQSVRMHGLDDFLADYVARVEIGDVLRTIWTPNNLSDVVDLDSIVEGVEHRIDRVSHVVTFQLTPRPTGGFILDDLNRGLLDTSELTY